MKYDPIKRELGGVFNKKPVLRKLFYRLLDVLLLRTWHVKRAIKSNFKNCKKTPLQTLDAGMGFGQYSYFLARKFPAWQIKGIDVKEEQVFDCNSFFKEAGLKNAYFFKQDLTELKDENCYDFILSVDVMEHIEEDDQVFSCFFRAMKSNGMLLISTPSDQGGSDVHEHDKDEHSFIDEHVRDGYNIDAIQEQLKKAGFSRTEAHYSYGIPGRISWNLSMKFPISILNVSKLFYTILPFHYIIFFPWCLLLNWIDATSQHKTGTGLIVKAWKE
ncbi:MAG: class I SAM-dependent methyltransferase [Bacteroidales bacterium]|jgi:2-polyprenyl-3-methyl-5-hydroxy-6-metoxy-1,4-benzoquinol methylase|nr:class I SAM-dependent methyltransferase [Bacteroidales bacterium]